MSCCDLCDSIHTEKMHTADPIPKSTRNPNKIKIDENRQLTPLDVELEHRLKEFRVKLHTEWWKDMEDHFLGPHIFLNRSHIRLLCNLASAGPLTTVDDLHNNFKWNWMDDHGTTLLGIIHNVYGHSPPAAVLPDSNKISEVAITSDDHSAMSHVASTSSDSKPHAKPRVKKGPGSQRCSTCQGFGHNKSNPQCPKKVPAPPLASSDPCQKPEC
ncbi:uncharacterized protein EI90DRAFT_3133943 [Cantharellus anzutake]|uniref:uncharacterized protein n=1 Tax=Cantharellus anzutake TaxID=1750568 RepID=UPI001902EDB4|nr:uncharacterized protein EI90DRAFT_3133943 [Cantharellus anzutake]KAF8317296.1 hypothetical protein EI90DRAFT_3133943 [Cantharellus anzutake]